MIRRICPLDPLLPGLLTQRQIQAINDLTALGFSQKTVIRRLINLGLERERGGRWARRMPWREQQ